MNKKIMLDNIKKLITSLEITIENLESIIGLDKSYSKEQVDKEVILLQIRLQDDSNYQIVSSQSKSLKTLIKSVQSERNTLRRLIGATEFRNSFLNQQIDKNNSILSFEQREIEALANSLNMSDNDEEIYAIIKQKRIKIAELKKEVALYLEQVGSNDEGIQSYLKNISDLDVKEAELIKELESSINLEVDENRRGKDINKLNKFLLIKDFYDQISELEFILQQLYSLQEYLINNRIDAILVEQKLDEIKENISVIVSGVTYFAKALDIRELQRERNVINDRINSKNGYVLNDSERELVYDEIASLQLSISLDDSISSFDDIVLSEYTASVDKLKQDIEGKMVECDLLQNIINELVSKKLYFFKEYSQTQIDDIDKEIRKKEKQLENLKRVIEKYMKSKTDIETAITFIKKKKKSNDILKESRKTDLRNMKEFAFARPTSKYNLNEDKKEVLYIDLFAHLIGFATDFINQDFIKKLDEINMEDPYLSVVGFYKYDNLEVLYSKDFIMKARKTMEEKLNEDVVTTESVIEDFMLQGLTVSKYGRSLKTMEEEKTVDKTVRLAA